MENENNNPVETDTLGDIPQNSQPAIGESEITVDSVSPVIAPAIENQNMVSAGPVGPPPAPVIDSAPLVTPTITEGSNALSESKIKTFFRKTFVNWKQIVKYSLLSLSIIANIGLIIWIVDMRRDLKDQKAVVQRQETLVADQKATIDSQLNCTVCPEVAPVAAETPAPTPTATSTAKTYSSTSSQESVTLPPPPPAD